MVRRTAKNTPARKRGRDLISLLAVVRVADGVCLGVPAHVRHPDCLGASVSVLPGPGGCGAGLRGPGRLVAPSGGSTVSGPRHLHDRKSRTNERTLQRELPNMARNVRGL